LVVESIAYPLTIAIQADGNIRRYQQVVGLIFIALVPLSYLFFSWSMGVIFVFIVRIIQNVTIMFYRLFYLHRIMSFKVGEYVHDVVILCMIVMAFSFILPWSVYELMNEGWLRMIVVMIVAEGTTSLSIYFVGLSTSERYAICKYVKERIRNNDNSI
jgi:hypothetical protein